MKIRFATIVTLTALAIAQSTTADSAVPSFNNLGWGPSWMAGTVPGGMQRPTKFEATETRTHLSDDESRIGLAVGIWADGEIVKGHQYQLLYQLRLQSKKGEEGSLLGNAGQPNGATFLVASAVADDKWNGLEGAVDITRKELSTLSFPKGKTVTVRVEPQLLDMNTNKFLTVPKSDAIILKVSVSDNGYVYSVVSLSSWIKQSGRYDSDQVADTVDELDAFDAEGNQLAEALGSVLVIKEVPAKIKVRLLHDVPQSWVHEKHPALWTALHDLANSDDVALRAAAKEKLK